MTQHKRFYTVIALGTIATIGIWDGSRGVVLPHFLADLQVGPAVGSQIFAASAVGSLITSLSFGALTHRFRLGRVALLGLLTTALALTLFLTLRLPLPLMLANGFLGLGLSMVEMSTDLPISLLYGETQSSMLNLLHGCFGVGALLGSLWAALLFGLHAPWEVVLGSSCVVVVVWGVIYQRLPSLPLPQTTAPEPGAPRLQSWHRVLRDPLVWVAALALSAAVAGEVGVIWLPSYLQAVKGLDQGQSAVALSGFFAGFTGMRLGGGWVVRRLGEIRAMMLLGLLGGTGLLLLLLLPGSFYWLAVTAGMGVAIGFATCTALVATRYPDRVNQVYTVMYSAGGVAAIVTTPLMGWVAQRAGYTAAMYVMLSAYLALVVLVSLFGWIGGRPTSGASALRSS